MDHQNNIFLPGQQKSKVIQWDKSLSAEAGGGIVSRNDNSHVD